MSTRSANSEIKRSNYLKSTPSTLACVLDPALALSQYGVLLVKQLRSHLEIWISRELWHILNNTSSYLLQPSTLISEQLLQEEQLDRPYGALQETLWSLRQWAQLSEETDLTRLNLFWLGDSLRESFLPNHQSSELFWQWEAIASSLDAQLKKQTDNYLLPLAFRDTVSLAVSLGSAFILTYQLSAETQQGNPPAICKALSNWGIPCTLLSPQDPIIKLERDYFHQLLIHTNTATLLWAGINLAVLHLLAPGVPHPTQSAEYITGQSLDDRLASIGNCNYLDLSWAEVKGYWYPL